MIVGAMKCGTTTLADALKEHPAVSFCRVKEPEFFSKHADWRAGLSEYHALFEQREGALYAEASTGLTFYPHFNLGVWNDLFAYDPGLKFIYLVRDPIDRIVSHYMHIYERGFTNAPLGEALRKVPVLLNVSRYHAQIAPFIERFGRQRVLILDFQRLVSDRAATLRDVAAFAGIDPEGFPTAAKHSNASIGGTKPHHRFDDPGHWARHLRRVVPKPLRERTWRMLTRPGSRSFTAKPEFTAQQKEAIVRMLATDIVALGTLMDRDLSEWFAHAGLPRPSIPTSP